MDKEEAKNFLEGKPLRTGYEEYNLFELEQMLRGVLEYADPRDKLFIKNLAFEIDRKRRLN